MPDKVSVVNYSVDTANFAKELFDFLSPLVGQGCRADHHTHRADRSFVDDGRETLNCLTKAHLVAEAAVETVLAELAHPLDTLFLVVS